MSFRFAKLGKDWAVHDETGPLGIVCRVQKTVRVLGGPNKPHDREESRWTFRDADGQLNSRTWRNRDRAAHALQEYVARKAGAA